MPKSEQDINQQRQSPLKPLPEHLYNALLASIRTTLGNDWGTSDTPQAAQARKIRESLKQLGDAYMVGDPEQDQLGLHVDVWVDLAELDPEIADAVAAEALHGLGSQEILILCRAYEEDGIRYRFASGTVDAGVIGSVRLVGPYARDVAQLGRIGSGHISGFSA